VRFVSLTNDRREGAQKFVREFGIAWPCGYGASRQTLVEFGAFTTSRGLPGYELEPTLFVIGPDGRIRWSDDGARLRHQDAGAVLPELEAAIERALTDAPPVESPNTPP
jgi:hypothetical protein